ncbi:MAG: YcnI family protein [Rhizobiaceae bacterium]
MFRTIMLAALVSAVSAPAFAHATLEVTEAPVGSTYKAVLRVPHGCDGAPTIAVRIQIPEGVIAVKPMPKPGWTLEKIRGPYARSYDYYGTPMSEGVKEVRWSGGSLPDDEYDEFVVRGMLAGDFKVGDMLYFPAIQECPDGKAERWIEIPAAGNPDQELEMPAPGIRLIEKTGGH